MPKYANPAVLDNGPGYIKNNCNKVLAVITYAFKDSYATVTTPSNIVAEIDVASTDFSFSDVGDNRAMTLASGKQDDLANNTGDPTHFVFLDTTSTEVLWVTTETSSQTVTGRSYRIDLYK